MANVGDLIRINSDWAGDCPTLKVGDIAEIERVEHGDEHYVKGHKFDDGDDFFLFEDEFDIFRKAGEEDEKPCGGESSIAEQYTEVLERRKQASEDAVDHPSHYTQGRFETIEIIEEITQGYSDGYVSYCVGNALKYLARAPFKHESPVEDLRKARAYLDFAIKRFEAVE